MFPRGSRAQANQPTTHTQIVSRDELGIGPLPTLHLRLRNPSQATLSSRPRFMRARYWKSLFYDAKDRFLSDKTDDEVATSINIRKIEVLFDNMRDDLRRLCNDVKDEMKDMSLDEQRLVVEYWQQMQGFLIALLKWLQELFRKVLEEIKKGRRLNQTVLHEAFMDVFEALKRSLDEITDDEDGGDGWKKRGFRETGGNRDGNDGSSLNGEQPPSPKKNSCHGVSPPNGVEKHPVSKMGSTGNEVDEDPDVDHVEFEVIDRNEMEL